MQWEKASCHGLPYKISHSVSSPQMFRTFRRRGRLSLLIIPSQRSFDFTPLRITYPSLSILTSLSECHSPSVAVQSTLRLSSGKTLDTSYQGLVRIFPVLKGQFSILYTAKINSVNSAVEKGRIDRWEVLLVFGAVSGQIFFLF